MIMSKLAPDGGGVTRFRGCSDVGLLATMIYPISL
jgi:hypothetical protein